ncbi:MAG: hypothetical protein KAT79_01490 [candidate division Zixibacteria bacterium]|nr:hypothetical protein [candidate division Zixibacteria bacterium]
MAAMISIELMLFCLVLSGLYIALASGGFHLIARRLKPERHFPPELVEEQNFAWHAVSFVMDYLFFGVIPTFAYSFFYLILPLSGIRIGMAVALLAFTLGMVPTLLGLSIRMKFPLSYLLFFLLSMLIKLGGALCIIGYLYTL